MKRTLCALTVLALVPAALRAEGTGSGASFLSLDAGAGAVAMGGAVVSHGGAVGGVFWNPGGLGWLRGTEITMAHSEYGQSIRHEILAAAYGTDRLALAVSVRGLFLGGLEERIVPSAVPLSSFSAVGLAPAVSAARSFGRRCAAGATIRYLHQSIGADRASAVAGDVGVSVISGIRGLRAGAALANVGSGIKFAAVSSPLPARLQAGASYVLPGDALLFSGDMVVPFRGQPPFGRLGAEGVIRERVRLRAGYKGGLAAAGGLAGLTGGLGVRVRGYDVEYAVASHGALGPAHHFSLSFRPGRPSPGDRGEGIIAAELQRRARITAETFYQQGLAQARSDKQEEALASFDLALIWDPAYGDAARASVETRAAINERDAGRHLASGLADYRAGKPIDAIAKFSRALEINPDHPVAREWLAKVSDALFTVRPTGGEPGDSTAVLVDRRLRAGAAALSAKDYARAIGEWSDALALDPNHAQPRAWIEMTRALQRREVEEAIQQADRLAAQGRWSAALAQANRALSLDPGNDDVLAKRQDITTAMRELSGAYARNGIGLYDRGSYGQAEVELKMALSLDKDNKAAAEYLAQAVSRLANARKRDAGDLYLKGISAYTKEEYEQALFYWQRVLVIDPGHANARRNIERAREKLKIMGR